MNERIKILEMVEQGKITAEEGAKLLSAIEEGEPKREPATEVIKAEKKDDVSYLKIRVFEGDMEKPKVKVNIPLALAKLGMQFVPDDKMKNLEIKGKPFDLDAILKEVSENFQGELVNVEDVGEDGKTTMVKIFIE